MNKFYNDYDYRNNNFKFDTLNQPLNPFTNAFTTNNNQFNRTGLHTMNLNSFRPSESVTPSYTLYNNQPKNSFFNNAVPTNNFNFQTNTNMNKMQTMKNNQRNATNTFNFKKNNQPYKKQLNTKNNNSTQKNNKTYSKYTKNDKEMSELSNIIKLFLKKLILNFIESKIDDWLDEILNNFKTYLNSEEPVTSTKDETPKINTSYYSTKNYEETEHVDINCNDDNNLKNDNITKNFEENIKAYNEEPFNQPCPINEFSNELINVVKVNDDNFSLPNKKENTQIMDEKFYQYKQNYNFAFLPQCNFTEVLNNMKNERNNTELNFENEFEVQCQSPLEDLRTQFVQKNQPLEIRTKMNLNNINIISDDNNEDNKLYNDESSNIKNSTPKNKLFSKIGNLLSENNESNDFKNFIMDEILGNLTNHLNNSKIEESILNMIQDSNKSKETNLKNDLSNSDSEIDFDSDN